MFFFIIQEDSLSVSVLRENGEIHGWNLDDKC